jgi:hypothetical protein
MRSEFWGGVVASLQRRDGRDIGTLALIVMALLLAMSIGPFSAIMILPRSGSWPMPDNYPGLPKDFSKILVNDVKQQSELLSGALSTAGLYPMNISESGLGVSFQCQWDKTRTDKPPCNSVLNINYDALIPQTVALSTTAENLEDSYYSIQLESFAELTATTIAMGYTSLFVASEAADFDIFEDRVFIHASAVAGATMTTALINNALTLQGWLLNESGNNLTLQIKPRLTDQAGKKVIVKQPMVFTGCVGGLFKPDNFTAATQLSVKSGGIFPGFNLTVGKAVEALYHRPGRPASFMSYVDVQDHVPFPISTAALIVTPAPSSYGNNLDLDAVHLCLVSARWVEADTWLDVPLPMSGVHPEWRTRDKVQLAKEVSSLDRAQVISIDPDFMANLNMKPFSDGNSQSNNTAVNSSSAYDYIASRCAGEPSCAGLAISGMLAYTLSLAQCTQIQCSIDTDWFDFHISNVNFTRMTNPTQAKASGNYSTMTFNEFITTYGYGFDDNVPAIIGFVLLLLHVALVLFHIGMIVFHGFWTSDAWTSLGELIVLAAASNPSPLLRNNGAGIRKWRKWQLTAKVRESVPEERLELIFGRDNNTRPAQDNEDGISLQDENIGLILPRPDKKYR